jgi:hypothetical protein
LTRFGRLLDSQEIFSFGGHGNSSAFVEENKKADERSVSQKHSSGENEANPVSWVWSNIVESDGQKD